MPSDRTLNTEALLDTIYQLQVDLTLLAEQHADSHPLDAWRIGSLRHGLNRRGRPASMPGFNESLHYE